MPQCDLIAVAWHRNTDIPTLRILTTDPEIAAVAQAALAARLNEPAVIIIGLP